ncbi:MAG: DoxX family protein [Acidobacteriota bacterium]|nr:MAG: DoxX family protein [Acidobacteriota bacterium]
MASLTATTATWMTVPIRLVLGAIMFAHGGQKVLGLWGGRGFTAWIGGVAPLNLRPSAAWLAAAALTEFIGGAMVFVGFYTRPAAFLICCNMAVAIIGIHWASGFFLSNGGYEFALSIFGMALALAIGGGGNASIDAAMNK